MPETKLPEIRLRKSRWHAAVYDEAGAVVISSERIVSRNHRAGHELIAATGATALRFMPEDGIGARAGQLICPDDESIAVALTVVHWTTYPGPQTGEFPTVYPAMFDSRSRHHGQQVRFH